MIAGDHFIDCVCAEFGCNIGCRCLDGLSIHETNEAAILCDDQADKVQKNMNKKNI